MSEIKLLPCPFCGGEAEIGASTIWCTNEYCGSELYHPLLSREELIKQWNTRKPMERIIERIENARQKYQRLVKEQGEKEDEAMNIHFRGVMNIVKEEGGIE